ncbi:hypothetical protein TWF718_001257 [Orbilia javanica]|uniref:Uncharacterized protein n=1 Tax=Orbilia javanica TaxID=47235 RepID=A0AAN8NDL0_9PEZI
MSEPLYRDPVLTLFGISSLILLLLYSCGQKRKITITPGGRPSRRSGRSTTGHLDIDDVTPAHPVAVSTPNGTPESDTTKNNKTAQASHQGDEISPVASRPLDTGLNGSQNAHQDDEIQLVTPRPSRGRESHEAISLSSGNVQQSNKMGEGIGVSPQIANPIIKETKDEHPTVSLQDSYPVPNWKPLVLRPWFIGLIVFFHLGHLSGILWIVFAQGYSHDDYLRAFLWTEDGAFGYFLRWQFLFYLPQIVLGVIWVNIDAQLRRILPYSLLARPEGALGHESVCESDGNLLVIMPFLALARKRPEVFLSSTIAITASLVLPTTTALMWELDIGLSFARPELNFSGIYLTIGFIVLVLLLAAALIWRLTWSFKSGLYDDFDNLAGLAALICDSGDILNLFHGASFQDNKTIDKLVKSQRFYLKHISTTNSIAGLQEPRYQITMDPTSMPRNIGLSNPRSQILTPLGAHPFVLSFFFSFLVDSVLAAPTVAFRLALGRGSDWDPMVVKGILAFNYSVYTAALTAVFNACLTMEPYKRLQSHDTILRSHNTVNLSANLRSHSILASIWLALNNHCVLSALTGVRVIFMVFSSAVIPTCIDTLWKAVLIEIDPYSSPTAPGFLEDLSVHLIRWVYALLALNFIGYIAVLFGIGDPILPRIPNTIASRMAYLVHSERLLSDVRGYSTGTMKQLSERLKERVSDPGLGNHGYGLGYIRKDRNRTTERVYEVGIERGPLYHKYVYPWVHPGQQIAYERYQQLHKHKQKHHQPRSTAREIYQMNRSGLIGNSGVGNSNGGARDMTNTREPELPPRAMWHGGSFGRA